MTGVQTCALPISQRVDQDPEDREETVEEAGRCGAQRLANRHLPADHGKNDRKKQAGQRRLVRLDPEHAEKDEEEDERQCGTNGRQDEGSENWIEYLLKDEVSTLRSWSRRRDTSTIV